MPRVVALNGLLLAAMALVILGVQVLDRDARAIEATVRTYAEAVSNEDLETAAAAVAPGERERWRGWIEPQLGNKYGIRGMGIRSHTVLEQVFQRASGAPFEATVAIDVNPGTPDLYRAATRVQVTRVDGAWYLVQPLLEPEADAAG